MRQNEPLQLEAQSKVQIIWVLYGGTTCQRIWHKHQRTDPVKAAMRVQHPPLRIGDSARSHHGQEDDIQRFWRRVADLENAILLSEPAFRER